MKIVNANLENIFFRIRLKNSLKNRKGVIGNLKVIRGPILKKDHIHILKNEKIVKCNLKKDYFMIPFKIKILHYRNDTNDCSTDSGKQIDMLIVYVMSSLEDCSEYAVYKAT